MVTGILAAAGVKGVGIGKKRPATESLDLVNDNAKILGTQIGEVSLFAEAGLDGDKVAFPDDFFQFKVMKQSVVFGEISLAAVSAAGDEKNF